MQSHAHKETCGEVESESTKSGKMAKTLVWTLKSPKRAQGGIEPLRR